MKNIKYISVNKIIDIHETVLSISGGRNGIKDYGQISSVTEHIQNDCYYPTYEEKLTHLIFAIAQFHMFIDGNKRTSIAAATEFLNINGFSYLVDQFIVDMEIPIVMVADSKIDKTFLFEIIKCILSFGELSEELQWKIIALHS